MAITWTYLSPKNILYGRSPRKPLLLLLQLTRGILSLSKKGFETKNVEGEGIRKRMLSFCPQFDLGPVFQIEILGISFPLRTRLSYTFIVARPSPS